MAKAYWLERARIELDRMDPDEREAEWTDDLWEPSAVEALAHALERFELPLILAPDPD